MLITCFCVSMFDRLCSRLPHIQASLLRRGLFVLWRGWRERKRKHAGHDGTRSSPARFLFFRLLLFLLGYPAGTSAEERASKSVTRGQLFGRVTRNSQQLFIPLFKTAAGQRSFQYRVVSLWNSLDKDLKLSKNCRDFKQKLTQILLHKFLDPSSVS